MVKVLEKSRAKRARFFLAEHALRTPNPFFIRDKSELPVNLVVSDLTLRDDCVTFRSTALPNSDCFHMPDLTLRDGRCYY